MKTPINKDSRFDDNNILFNFRKNEWNPDNILQTVESIFSKMDLIENWKLKSVGWIETKDIPKIELKSTKYGNIKVVLNEYTKTNEIKKVHEYIIQIPELVNDNYFYIGGFFKVPTFQLFDYPVIYRLKPNGDRILKFKNNAMSISCFFEKDNSIKCNTFLNQSIKLSKRIPIEYLIVNSVEKEDFLNFIKTVDNENAHIKKIIEDCKKLWSLPEKDYFDYLGKFKINYVKSHDLKKSRDIIKFGIDVGCDIDLFTKKFMKTANPVLEIIKYISDGPVEENNMDYKRVRFMEYIFSGMIKKVYDMICILKYNKKIKYKITPTVVMDECNVSSLVNFDFSTNPLEEITSLLKVSLVGPGSFIKETVPIHMKNINESQYGKICPVDTPDRDSCGVILNLIPNKNVIDSDGRFNKNVENHLISSFPITYVPFMRNNDQTRLQMASSQQRQSINILENEIPEIVSGAESEFLTKSNYYITAKRNGKVIYKDNVSLVVLYDDGTSEHVDIGYQNKYLDTSDFYTTDLVMGKSFKKNTILAQSNFIKNSNVCLGINLNTMVAVWKGYNFEDGLVVSESAAKRFTSQHSLDLSFEINPGQILLSLNSDEYIPIPKVGDRLYPTHPYAKIKYTHSEILEHINLDSKDLYPPKECVVTNVEVYPNIWNKQIPEFDNFIKSLIIQQNKKIDDIKTTLKDNNVSEKDIKKFIYSNPTLSRINTESKKVKKFYDKMSKINGVKIRIDAIYTSKLECGDKLSNRAGSKGVIGIVIPDSEMPVTEDGRRVDIIANPAGIVSRMNIGQLYELNCGESLYNLKNMLTEFYNERSNNAKIMSTLNEFLNIIDKTDDKWITEKTLNEFKETSNKLGILDAIKNIRIIQPCFKSIGVEDLFKLMELTNSKFKQRIYDPVEKTYLDNPVSFGRMYFMKLVHRSSEKIFGRSIGPYVQSTLQPVAGKKKSGGHKLGEMEVWCLIAHGAKKTLNELLTTHSDTPYKKNLMLAEMLDNKHILENFKNKNHCEMMKKPRATALLYSYLKILGIDVLNS